MRRRIYKDLPPLSSAERHRSTHSYIFTSECSVLIEFDRFMNTQMGCRCLWINYTHIYTHTPWWSACVGGEGGGGGGRVAYSTFRQIDVRWRTFTAGPKATQNKRSKSDNQSIYMFRICTFHMCPSVICVMPGWNRIVVHIVVAERTRRSKLGL